MICGPEATYQTRETAVIFVRNNVHLNAGKYNGIYSSDKSKANFCVNYAKYRMQKLHFCKNGFINN